MTNADPNTTQRHQLRRHYRQLRRQLSPAQQQQAAQQLAALCARSGLLDGMQHLALYLANDGELSPAPLIEQLWKDGKKVYLPVLHPFNGNTLLFIHYTEHSPMVKNRFGILEPQTSCPAIQPIANLDVIFTPLVAFDSSGNRLGMGGGFYDRTLAHLCPDKPPALYGLAHDCQECRRLPTQTWDVPLAGIITPTQLKRI